MKKRLVLFSGILVLLSQPAFSDKLNITDLGDLGGNWSESVAINEMGQVTGTSYTDTDFSAISRRHAFSWTSENGMVDLGTIGGTWSESVGINDSGQVIGRSVTNAGFMHAFVWTAKNGIIDLGALNGNWSWPTAINGAGQVVGQSYNYGDHAFFWTPESGMIDMGLEFGGHHTKFNNLTQ